MGRKDKSRERMRKIEELRNRRLLDTPWDKPKTIPTFAEVRTSSRVRGFLKRKVSFYEGRRKGGSGDGGKDRADVVV